MKTFIIAEAGVNHNGSLELGKKLIRVAKEAGADAVKFQTFDPAALTVSTAPLAGYQAETVGQMASQRKMLEKLALSFDDFERLKSYCDRVGIEFMSTPFDERSARFLTPFVRRFKIGSGDLTTHPLLGEIGKLGKEVILSTGMGDLAEIAAAIQILKTSGSGPISLLHCTSGYPCPDAEVNLRAMVTLKEHFGLPVGYSDHTPGSEASVGAVALGASIIEKHFTLDRSLEGPDHRMSLTRAELTSFIASVRRMEVMRGDGQKRPTDSELSMKRFARRSLVWNRNLPAGTIVTIDCLTWKRPGTGISPAEIDRVIGKVTLKAVSADALVEETDLALSSRTRMRA